MPNQLYNPIVTVDGASVPCPSKFVYGLQDVSAPDAGRTEDTKMQKMRLGQCVTIELQWNYLTDAQVATVMQAFNPEYISVKYKDAVLGTTTTKEFYVGDRAAPMYNSLLGLWESVSFKIIERKSKYWNNSTHTWQDIVTGVL